MITDYSVATPAITLANNGTQVTAANVAAGTTAHVLHKFSAAVTTANATLNAVAFTTAGTYQTADITNLRLRYSTDATLDSGDATLATITTPAATGAKSFSSLSQTINAGSTGYFFITADIAAAPTAGRTISVNAIGTADLTFAAGTKSGSTTAGGAQTLQAASTPTITVSAGTLAFGNVQQNGTSSELTYTVSGVNLTANIVLTAPTGFEISTTSGSGFGSSVTLTQSGGTVASTTIYVRFNPTAVTSYSANITHTSTGATTQNKAVTGTGIYSSASDIIRDTSFTEPSNIAYASHQEANLTSSSLQVGSFTIRDGGGSSDLDSAGTTLSAITFNVANHANVRRIALYDGSTELGEVAGGATATFTGLSVAAADNGTKTLTLRASFNASVTDNQQITFTVASATAASSGSDFAAADAGGAASSTTGDRNRIEVTATKLAFSSVPASVSLSANFTAEVQAVDANDNLDLDSTALVTISKASGAGTLTGGGNQNLVAGVRSFSTLQMDTAGTFTIQATAAGLTTATSSSITAVDTSLANALDNTNQTWTTSGSGNWFYQTTTTHDTEDAAQSGAITHNQSSILETTVTGPGVVTFWWNVSSESGYDFLEFWEDSTEIESISGSPGWAQVSHTITASGSVTLQWRYTKDVSGNVGSDAGWVDEVTYTPCPSAPTANAATNIGGTSFSANWSSVSGATGYLLDVSTNDAFSGGAPAGDLIFSQYVDTDSGTTPKGVEVWNATGSAITFDSSSNELTIEVGVNGGSPSEVFSLTSGTLAAGDVLVIGTTDMTPDHVEGFTFNGDDSIVLKLGGVTTDVIGNPGSDPGSSWSGGGVSTADQNIQLKTGITAGDTDGWTDPSVRFETVSSNPSGAGGLTGFGTPPVGGGGGGDFIDGYEAREVGNVTTFAVTGLTAGVTYYYRVRATNNACSSDHSNTQSVTTVVISAPTVSSTAASVIAATSATLGGNVTSDGGASVTDRGVVYKTSSGVTIADNKTQIGSGTGSFSQSIGSLSVNTRYWHRAYATNSVGTTLGSELNFWTLANTPSAPTVDGPTPTSLNVSINPNGNPAATEFSIRVGSNYVQSDGTLGASEVWLNAAGWGSPRTVNGLAPSTTYTFDVRARNGANTVTAWSATQDGTTSVGASAPSVTTTAPTATNTTTATVGGNVTADNGSTVTNRGVVYATAPGVTLADNKTQQGSGTGTYSVNLTGLSVNTRYYYRAYAQNAIGDTLGSELNFWTWANTPSAPTVSGPATNSLNVNVNPNGNPAATLFAIQENGSGLYVQTNGTLGATAHWRTDANWANATVSGLNPNATYGFRVQAKNGAGVLTAWSGVANGTTLAAFATLTTTAITAITPTTAQSGGDISSDGGAAITQRGVVWNTTGAPTTADSSTTNGTGTGSFTSSLTGLTPGQTYYVRAYAINLSGTAYGDEVSFAADCFNEVVTGLLASATNSTDFTASWDAFAGASGYRLDVATNVLFTTGSGLEGTEVFTNVGGGTTSSYLTRDWTNNGVAWTAYNARTDQTVDGAEALTLRDAADAWFVSQNITGGVSELELVHQQQFTGSGGQFDVFVNSIKVATNIGISTSVLTTRVSGINIPGVFTITVTNNGSVRPAFSRVEWSNEASPAFVPGYSNRVVSGTSQAVTGLTAGVTYYFRVQATNAFCVTDHSATQTVTTAAPDFDGPTPSALLVNGGSSITDNAFSGGVDLTVTWQDNNSGLDTTPAPSFTVYYPDGTTEAGTFTAGYAASVTTPVVVTNAAALDTANWIPGTYTVLVSAVDSDGNTTTDEPFTFTLVDDDDETPQFFGNTIDGVGGQGDTDLLAGAIAILGVNGAPDTDVERFSFVVLSPFPAGTVLRFTDRGWDPYINSTGTWWRPSEFHTNSWVSPGDASVGQVVELTLDDINNAGDQVVIYQYDGLADADTDPDNVRFLFAVNLDVDGDGWDPDPIPNDNEHSGLYRGLTNGYSAVSVPLGGYRANAIYTGTVVGTASDLLLAITDSNNWEAVGPGNVDMNLTNFQFNVTGAGDFDWDIPELTDAQINQGGYIVTNLVQDLTSGILASNTAFGHAPYFALYGTNDSVIASNVFPATFNNGSTAVEELIQAAPAGVYEEIYLGTYSSVVAVADADDDRNDDSLSGRFAMQVVVVDDDETPPQAGDDLISIMIDDTALDFVVTNELLAAWNFNDDDYTRNHGASGTMTVNLPGTISWFGGTAINAVGTDVAGNALSPSASGNIGGHLQFELDMSLYQDLVMTFAAQRTSTGYDDNQVSYSINGVDYTDFGAPFDLPTSYALQTYDFSSVTELDGVSQVFIRITLGVNVASGGGNNRYDNVQFSATPIQYVEITDAQLADISGSNPLRFSFNAFDADSALVRGTAFDHTNMMVTIDGLVTNNTANYLAGLSSADSTLATATSLWEFTSFTYNQIGDLFAGGLSNRPIRATFADADNDRPFDATWQSNRVFGSFRVIDDDVAEPESRNVTYTGAAARPFMVLTNGVASPSGEFIRGSQARRSGTGTSTVFKISDAELVAAGDIGLQFAFGALDVHSGINRDATGPDTNAVMSFSVGSSMSGNFADFNAALSTSQSDTNQVLTNIWAFGNSSFSGSLINDLIAAGQQPVQLTIPDTDNDRPNDRATLISEQVGFLQVIDDDIRGPVIPFIDLPDVSGGSTLLYTSFETDEGWPSFQGSGNVWTNEITSGSATGTWYGTGYVNTGDPFDGVRKAGFTVNGVGEYFQLPPREDVGQLGLVARLSSGETNRYLTVEQWNGASWDPIGSNAVTSSEYEYLTWNINTIGESTLRIIRSGENGTPGIFIDSVTLSELTEWVSTTLVSVAWGEAIDDYSAVDEYRVVTPTVSASVPATTNAGSGLSAALTSHVFNVVGHQGVITGFVFAIDNDDDRPGDRAVGNVQSVIVRIDTNPPLPVVSLRATDAANDDIFDETIDESSEIKIEWAPGGSSAAQAAGWRQSDSTSLSPWATYMISYYEVDDTNGIPVADAVTNVLDETNPAWSNLLNNWAFTNVVLSNLVFDTYYRIEVQGRDQAGNIGLVTGVIGNTDRFILTQGIAQVGGDVKLLWTGPPEEDVTRDYDVIYVDSSQGFRDSLSNQWEFLKYTNRPRAFDAGGVGRLPPQELTNGVFRFYRVAREDRWKIGNGNRLASAEVYVTKALPLNPGENWHSLFFEPDINTIAYVFGTNLLTGGEDANSSPKISWYGSTNIAGEVVNVATMVVWLADNSSWRFDVGGTGVADDFPVPLHQGFNLELPPATPPINLTLIGRVPTNDFVHPVMQGVPGATNYHIISHRFPVRTKLTDLNLIGSGLKSGVPFGSSATWPDEIRILNNQTNGSGIGMGSMQSPARRYYLRNGNFYRWPGTTLANNDTIDPSDMMVIVQYNHAGSITWTNTMNYSPPTKNITP